MTRELTWYVRRLRRMSPAEISSRVVDQGRQRTWAHRQVRPGQVQHGRAAVRPSGLRTARRGPVPLAADLQESIPAETSAVVIRAADALLQGSWSVLGVPRPDIREPDWFWDPVTGLRAPSDQLAFRVDHRDEAVTGNVKQVWELSRHHHLTVLAGAYWLTGEEAYADAVDDHLRSWWAANPFLSGVHWTSGIELGVRLISWAWVRRLLDGWPKVGDLFEDNDDAVRQIRWHQDYLASFRSHGSSANNHAVAEDAGQLVAACAFPWYPESDRRRARAMARLSRHFLDNTGPDGVNRELATDYHRFVTELVAVAVAEARAFGTDVPGAVWERLAASFDAAAAMLDVAGAPPRQGDADEGRALVLDDPEHARWLGLLDWGKAVVGGRDWWPEAEPTVVGAALAALVGQPRSVADRPTTPPRHFPDAGITIVSSDLADGPEIWCRCDGGPLGYLSIAAHGHADALAVEVRYDGVELLVDPGTYCYHGEQEWRSYFRSTRAHNTVELDAQDQAVEGGPFLWSTQVPAEVLGTEAADGHVRSWTARHLGYDRLPGAPIHSRSVDLDPAHRVLRIVDRVVAEQPCDIRMFFHLGSDVEVRLEGLLARLDWVDRHGTTRHAVLRLPDALSWSAHTGETDPILGWYSPRFGARVPITTLVGTGSASAPELVTSLTFQAQEGARHG